MKGWPAEMLHKASDIIEIMRHHIRKTARPSGVAVTAKMRRDDLKIPDKPLCDGQPSVREIEIAVKQEQGRFGRIAHLEEGDLDPIGGEAFFVDHP